MANVLQKQFKKFAEQSKPTNEEKSSWTFARYGFVIALLGIAIAIASGGISWYLANTANKLAKFSVALAKKADSNTSQLDAIKVLIEKQQTQIAAQNTMIFKQDAQIQELKTLVM